MSGTGPPNRPTQRTPAAVGTPSAPTHHARQTCSPTAGADLGRAESPNSPEKAGRFRFTVTVRRGPSVILKVAGTSHPGLTAHAVPDPAVTVPARGTPRAITVEITVSDHPALPPEVDHPHFSA